MGSADGCGVGIAVGVIVGWPVGLKLGAIVGLIVGDPEGINVGRVVGADVGSRVGSAVGEVVGSRDGRAVGSMVGRAEGSRVGSTVGSGVGRLLGSSDGSAEGSRVGGEDGARLGSAVGSGVGRFVGSRVGRALGSIEGSAEGSRVGRFVGSVVGIVVGSSDGSAEGSRVGGEDGARLGSAVGFRVIADGSMVGIRVGMLVGMLEVWLNTRWRVPLTDKEKNAAQPITRMVRFYAGRTAAGRTGATRRETCSVWWKGGERKLNPRDGASLGGRGTYLQASVQWGHAMCRLLAMRLNELNYEQKGGGLTSRCPLCGGLPFFSLLSSSSENDSRSLGTEGILIRNFNPIFLFGIPTTKTFKIGIPTRFLLPIQPVGL